MKLNYRRICDNDAVFMTRLFSIPEYNLYFAENDTTEKEWKERFKLYEGTESNIIMDGEKTIGWIMYELQEDICDIFIIVLMDEERHKGYGKKIFNDLFEMNPDIKHFKLDVQQRNTSAVKFYQNVGFTVVSEEKQPVSNYYEMYYNMELIK